MAWPIPTANAIFERIAARLEQSLSEFRPDVDPQAISRAARSSHGMMSLLMRPVALEARSIHDHVAFWSRQYFIDTAEEEFVARHAAIWGLAKRPAIAASGTIKVTGTPQTKVPAGVKFVTADGKIIETTEAAIVSADRSTQVSAKSVSAGAEGNLSPQKLQPIEPIMGIDHADVIELMGGVDDETWDELKSRVLEHIRQPPHGGAGFDYQQWLKARFSIHALAVIPDWIGRGSVGLVVAMKDGNSGRAPTGTEVELMLDYLGRPGSSTGVRPVTAHVVIVPAIAKTLPLRIRVKPFSVLTKQAIEEAWAAFILTVGDQNDAFNNSPIGATIERSRMIEALSAAEGEYAHDLIEPGKTITLGRNEYPVAGPVTFVD